MNPFKKLSFLLLLALLTFNACKKDSTIDDMIDDEVVIVNPMPEVIVNASVSGIVLDDNHEPLQNATVRVGVHNVLSDENGVFTFKNIDLNENGALVSAEKNGYFYNAKFIRPRSNKMSFTKFKMLEKTISGTLAASSGGSIVTNGNATVIFPANGIKSEDGSSYSGNVNVYAKWLDPTGEDLLLEMPGDLRAMTTEDEQVQLTSFGMIGVELEGDNGEALNIADGQTATIEMPVPSTLLGNAPATIPLWHFDELSGMWVEEGQATLQGDKYVGTVSHFSFWNCDVPFKFIDLTGSVINESGGIQNLQVQITDNSNGTSGFAYTDEDGVFGGFVPNDVVLTIIIFDNCGDELYNEQIGPFSVDTPLDPIVISNNLTNSVSIGGSLIDCDMNPVTNGYVKVNYGNTFSILQVNQNGTFNSTISICSATELTLVGFDFNNVAQSEATVFDVSGMNSLNAGTIEVCDELEGDYLITTVNGVTNTFLMPVGSIDPVTGEVSVIAIDSLFNSVTHAVVRSFATEINTTYTPTEYEGAVTTTLDNTEFAFCDGVFLECGDLTVTYSSLAFTNPGDEIKGQCSGTINGSSLFEVSAQFRVTKQ